MSLPSKLPPLTLADESAKLGCAPQSVPAHVAIIMDGNGRWASARGLPRAEGHRRGVGALRRAVRAAEAMGIRYLTVYGFSTENWSRPADEISDLFSLLKLFIRRDVAELHQANVRVRVIGDRKGLDAEVVRLLDEAQDLTRRNTGLTFVVAFNYGGRQEITRAARALARLVRAGQLDPEAIDVEMLGAALDTRDIPDPDLVIRTSGEVRVSNFLPWQTAYSEFVFLEGHWPDFDEATLRGAVEQFLSRERRFGGRGAQVV